MIIDLPNKIKHFAQLYYDGKPEITDKEFDGMVSELKRENPTHPILHTVGWGYFPDPGKNKKSHLVGPVGSLDKIKYNEIDDFKPKSELLVITPKLDGGSMVAYYFKGILRYILTRGDGDIGVDVTQNMYHAVPHMIPNKSNMVAVRGECLITIEDFNKPIFEGLSHPRNAAVGLSQSLNPDQEKLHNVRFVAYSIIGVDDKVENENLMDKINQLNILKKEYKFETVPHIIIASSEIETTVNEDRVVQMLTMSMNEKTYPIDGLVISYPDGFASEHYSGNYTIENESIAYKFEDEFAVTTITDIEWNLSDTGRLVPLLNIETVNLEGANISNVTGNNFKWLQEREAGVGSKIEVIRANQVIPKLVNVIEKSKDLNEPDECPMCGTELKIVGVDLMCVNRNCCAKMIGIIRKSWNMIKPDGASDATFNLMISKLNSDMPFIISFIEFLNQSDVEEKDNHYENLIITAIKNYSKMKISIGEVIALAGIPTIGRRIGKRIESDIKSLDDYKKYLENGFPSEMFKSEVLNENLDRLTSAYQIWENKIMDKSENKKEYIRVAVTGSLSVPRTQWYRQMETYGVVKSGITKDTKYLVCNNPSSSSKFKKAADYGIPVLNEEEFIRMISN